MKKNRIYFILGERGAKSGGMVIQCNTNVENEVQFAFGWSFVCYFTSRLMLLWIPLNVILHTAQCFFTSCAAQFYFTFRLM